MVHTEPQKHLKSPERNLPLGNKFLGGSMLICNMLWKPPKPAGPPSKHGTEREADAYPVSRCLDRCRLQGPKKKNRFLQKSGQGSKLLATTSPLIVSHSPYTTSQRTPGTALRVLVARLGKNRGPSYLSGWAVRFFLPSRSEKLV